MGDPELTGRQCVDDRGEVGDVLEAEVARIGEVDMGLRTAIHHHCDAAPAVIVGHELDPSSLDPSTLDAPDLVHLHVRQPRRLCRPRDSAVVKLGAMPSPSDCLVIFDCDGVLVDGERMAVAIDVKAIGTLGWPITEAEVIELFLGRSEADMFAVIRQHIGRALPGDWVDRWSGEYRRAFDEELEAVSGVADAIKVVAAEGFRTCVASSGSHEKMMRTLRKTGLWDFFAGRIFSATEVERGKPEPDLFLYAAKLVGAAAARCVVVEDSRYGVAGAKAAGMKAIGFAGGITPAEHLAAADVVITDMSDLPGAVSLLLC